MDRLSVFKLCACCLGVLLLYTPASISENALNVPAQQQLNKTDILHKLAQADVVYLGETHDNAKDHETQLEIIEKLYGFSRQGIKKNSKSKIAIALEMFQRPYQSVINQYLAGEITAAQLVEQSEYQQRWGFPWEYYAPILEFAKKHQIPVLALNTPSEVTRKVSRQGLQSLNQEDWKYIPPISEIRTDNQEYRQLFEKLAGGHHQMSGNSQKLDNYFAAQVLWDETMADAIANFVKVNRDHQVIVLAGSGHIIYGYGIPSRVARRLQNGDTNQPPLIQRSLLLHSPEDYELEINQQQIADFIWK